MDSVSLDPRLEAGTPVTTDLTAYTEDQRAALEALGLLAPDRSLSDYAAYTVEQLVALDALKDRDFTEGVARAACVNHVLWPDGSLDSDVAGLRTTARALRDAIEDGTAPEWAHADAPAHSRLLQDIVDHVAEGRFLFVVSSYDHPRLWLIYFQCATESNPDVPPRVAAGE